MATPAEIMQSAASLLNDTARTSYTDTAMLPYFNLAVEELEEELESNNVPVTNEVSSVLQIDAGVTVVSFTTSPALPSNLIEIRQLWERTRNINPWVPVDKRDFIPLSHEDQNITQFLVWAWVNQEIRLIESTADNDLKLDYLQSVFDLPYEAADINTDIPIINIKTYLKYKTGSLCAMFIGENETRAVALEGKAGESLDRIIGIPTKGRQSISTRRRPFMGGYKQRGIV